MTDVHAHLNDERLLPRAEEIVNAMDADGLDGIIVVGYDFPSSKTAVALAEKYERVYAAVGCHPHDSKSYSTQEENFYKSVACNNKVVAVGEIGLDYHYDLSPRNIQKDIFARQLVLADELKLPVELHVRDAYKDALDVLTAHKNNLNSGVLLHCYGGSAEMVREFDRFDCYYSFGGTVTYKNANKGEVLARVRRERLLIETDCPYLAPVPMRGKDNEPKFISYTYNAIASLIGIDVAELETLTRNNARKLFGKLR